MVMTSAQRRAMFAKRNDKYKATVDIYSDKSRKVRDVEISGKSFEDIEAKAVKKYGNSNVGAVSELYLNEGVFKNRKT